MARYSLAAYTLRVKDKANNQYVQIDNFNNGIDIFNVFNTYLSNLTTNSAHDSRERKLLRVENLTAHPRERILNGIIGTGEWGYESVLYDITRDLESHRRRTNEAEILPFYYLINLPRNSNDGIIILQRFQQFGIRGVLLKDFNTYFDSQWPEFKIEINPLVPEQLVTQYLSEGRITKLRFIQFRLPNDLANFYESQDHIEEEGHTELVVCAKRNRYIPVVSRIQEYMDHRRELRRLIELQNFEYDTVKVEVMIHKNRRTIDLSNLNKIKAYYDITEELQVSDTGHPQFDSIDNIAESLLRDLTAALYGEPND